MSVDYNELIQLLTQDQLPSQHEGIIADLNEYLAKIKADELRDFAKGWGDGREGFPYFPLMERADRLEEEA